MRDTQGKRASSQRKMVQNPKSSKKRGSELIEVRPEDVIDPQILKHTNWVIDKSVNVTVIVNNSEKGHEARSKKLLLPLVAAAIAITLTVIYPDKAISLIKELIGDQKAKVTHDAAPKSR